MKSNKSKSANKRVKVKDLPSKQKKVSKDELKKVRGGADFNTDGYVDAADYVTVRAKTAQKVRGSL